MTHESVVVYGRVAEQLEDMVNALESDGARYARAYTRHVVERTRNPPYASGLHHLVAKAIRDVVMDEALAGGLLPAAKR